jgi:uncharacterized protein involved in exopolysaccharide biosynthesis
MSSNNNLSLVQATALASEINLVKNQATQAINKVTTNSSNLESLRSEVNTLTTKIQSLSELLSQATITGVNDASFNYNNL